MDREIKTSKGSHPEDVDTLELQWATEFAMRNANKEDPVHEQIQSAMQRFFDMVRNNNDQDIDINKFYEEEQRRFEQDYHHAQDQELKDDEARQFRESLGTNKDKEDQARKEIEEFERYWAKCNDTERDEAELEGLDHESSWEKAKKDAERLVAEEHKTEQSDPRYQELSHLSPQERLIKLQQVATERQKTNQVDPQILKQIQTERAKLEQSQGSIKDAQDDVVDHLVQNISTYHQHFGSNSHFQQPIYEQKEPQFGGANISQSYESSTKDLRQDRLEKMLESAEKEDNNKDQLERQFIREVYSVLESRDPISDQLMSFEQRLENLQKLTQKTLNQVRGITDYDQYAEDASRRYQEETMRSKEYESPSRPKRSGLEMHQRHQSSPSLTFQSELHNENTTLQTETNASIAANDLPSDFYQKIQAVTQQALKDIIDGYIARGNVEIKPTGNGMQKQYSQQHLKGYTNGVSTNTQTTSQHNSTPNSHSTARTNTAQDNAPHIPYTSNSSRKPTNRSNSKSATTTSSTPTKDTKKHQPPSPIQDPKYQKQNSLQDQKSPKSFLSPKQSTAKTATTSSSDQLNSSVDSPYKQSGPRIENLQQKYQSSGVGSLKDIDGTPLPRSADNLVRQEQSFSKQVLQEKNRTPPRQKPGMSNSNGKSSLTRGDSGTPKSPISSSGTKRPKDYDAQFLEVLQTVPEKIQPENRIVHKKVRIKNCGSKIWPLTTFIIPMDEKKGKTFRLNSVVKPGNELHCTLILNNPGKAGDFPIAWRIGYIDENLKTQWFGDAFQIELSVDQQLIKK